MVGASRLLRDPSRSGGARLRLLGGLAARTPKRRASHEKRQLPDSDYGDVLARLLSLRLGWSGVSKTSLVLRPARPNSPHSAWRMRGCSYGSPSLARSREGLMVLLGFWARPGVLALLGFTAVV